LGTGFEGIGIHGTHDNASIGKRITEGCIRLNNNDLKKLAEYVAVGIPVIIIPSKEDIQ
jgi:lipoprotein-anchoring transpeptidase ErfK/SrfK